MAEFLEPRLESTVFLSLVLNPSHTQEDNGVVEGPDEHHAPNDKILPEDKGQGLEHAPRKLSVDLAGEIWGSPVLRGTWS